MYMPKGVYIRSQETKDKISLTKLGKKLSVKHKTSISKGMKEKYLTDWKDKRKGKGNPNYKGGRVKDGWGYIQIKMPEHPFANSRGYIKEHRLVMEEKLGRYLTPDEIPHHIDFDKVNNDIDNLFLTDRKHNSYLNKSIHRLMKELIKKEIIVFDREKGEYHL